MFIERSAARIRIARAAFVLLGLLPCAGLCGWAVFRQSQGHREAVQRQVERAIGLPFRIGSIEHLRPNAMRLRNCRLSSPTGDELLSVPSLEVESLTGEIRVSLPRLDCGPEAARALAGLAAEWLRQPARFPVDCVVDVAAFSWRLRPAAQDRSPTEQDQVDSRPDAVHVECVAANGSRAVRLRRDAAAGTGDEIRLIAHRQGAAGDRGAEPLQHDALVEFEVQAAISAPLPVAVVAAIAGLDESDLPFGDEAFLTGSVEAVRSGGAWSGAARPRLDRLDLGVASMHLPHRLSGEALLDIERLEWSQGKITGCAGRCSVSRGRVGQRLLDALVSVFGCRPGPAYRSLARDEVRAFDDVTALFRIADAAVELRADPGRAGSLMRIQGLSALEEPQSPVPLERLAWVLSPPGAVAVPASRVAAWLIRCFAVDSAARSRPADGATPSLGPENGRSGPVPPLRSARRSEF